MNKKDIIGLGLESSCDETSAAIVKNGTEILSNKIFSQISIHQEYNGVVPEIASRAHLEVVNEMVEQALSEANVDFSDLDYVSATQFPGLVGSLMISFQSAKAISFVQKIPLIGVNHLEAHLYAPYLENIDLQFPYLGLLVSGGNTIIFKIEGFGQMEILSQTMDDAVGEAYDKVSKLLNLGYPGGPIIEKVAKQAKEKKMLLPKILAASNKQHDRRFSYSGLKTSVVNYVKNNPDYVVEEVAYSFQERALELLVRRTFQAVEDYGLKNIVVAGGVASNGRLRELLKERAHDEKIYVASPILCTDNAAMVAGLGYQYFLKKEFCDLSADVAPRLKRK